MPKNKKLVTQKNDFEAVTKRVIAAMAESVELSTVNLKSEAVQLAPKLLGELRNSARTEMSADGLVGIVSFNTPYAASQHERTDQAHPQGGQAKYLSTPLLNNRPRYEKNMAEAVKRAIGG